MYDNEIFSIKKERVINRQKMRDLKRNAKLKRKNTLNTETLDYFEIPNNWQSDEGVTGWSESEGPLSAVREFIDSWMIACASTSLQSRVNRYNHQYQKDIYEITILIHGCMKTARVFDLRTGDSIAFFFDPAKPINSATELKLTRSQVEELKGYYFN